MVYTQEQRDRRNAAARERRASDPDHAEKRRSDYRAWRERNAESDRARCKERRAKNPGSESENKRRYYQNRRKGLDKTEEGRAKDRDRKARRRAAIKEDRVTPAEWFEILERHNHTCAYCPSKGALEMDHVHPLSKGGRHLANNIVPACKPCNSRKGAKCG